MKRRSWLRTNGYGSCAKREVSRRHPWSNVMPGTGKPLLAAIALAVALTTSLVGAVGPAIGHGLPAASNRAGAAAFSLTNALVRADFPTAAPTFTLTSVANASLGLSQSLGGLAEVNRTGYIVAFALFGGPGVAWSGSTGGSSASTWVHLRAAVPARPASGDWESGDDAQEGGNASLGSVNVSLTFTLNSSSGPSPTTVGYLLNVTGWPWISTTDSLGVEVLTNTSGPSGYWQSNGVNSITERSSTTGGTVATYAWGTSATATYASGQESDSSVGAYHNVSTNRQSSLVRLDFGTVTGGYRSLGYDPWLTLVVESPLSRLVPAWLLGPDALVTIGAGTALSIALAAVALRRRRAPESEL